MNLEAREALEPRAPITVGCTPPCSVDIDPHNYYRNNQSEFRLDSVAKPTAAFTPRVWSCLCQAAALVAALITGIAVFN